MTFLFGISVCFLLTINNLINHINDSKCLFVLTKIELIFNGYCAYIGMKIILSPCLSQCFAQNRSNGTSGVINMVW